MNCSGRGIRVACVGEGESECGKAFMCISCVTECQLHFPSRWPNLHTLIDIYDFSVFDFFFVPDVSILSTFFYDFIWYFVNLRLHMERFGNLTQPHTKNNNSNEQIGSPMR